MAATTRAKLLQFQHPSLQVSLGLHFGHQWEVTLERKEKAVGGAGQALAK